MQQVYEKFGLQPDTIDFVGHAVALYCNDQYLACACGPTIEKIKLYMYSISRYGKSPFIYPLYGLGGLPEGFSRLSAIHGGTYMLNKPVDGFEYGPDGKVCGVRSGDEVAKCKQVICDPSYIGPEKKQILGKVVRCICILGAPIPNTFNALSCQIIIPQRQLKRQNDVFVTMVSFDHCVAAKDKYIAIVSTTIETNNPEKEIEPALQLLGPIEMKFMSVSDVFAPVDDGTASQVFVTPSNDPTSHFEAASDNVLQIWQRLTGTVLYLTVQNEEELEQ